MSPKREWILTLGGSQAPKNDSLSLTYQAAFTEGWQPEVENLVPAGTVYLPPRDVDAISEDICKNCPVKVRCFAADDPAERG
jgi:hypothetical protein